MIAAESVVPKHKLKIKFPILRIESVSAPQSLEFGQQLSSSFDGKRKSYPGNSKETYGASKRRPEGVIMGGPQEKRRKMDRSMTQQCTTLLNALMKHPAGWVFNQPVDPIALKIPDYFSIIKNPMDLGTIKSKLVKNAYLGIEEFVADIRLTFSNAMLYNPPSNNVHKMAQEMNEFFESRWKSLEEKWNQENFKVGNGKISSVRLKDVDESRQGCPKIQLSRNSSLPKKSKPSEEKVENVTLNVRAAEVETPKPTRNSVSKLPGKNLQKDVTSERLLGGDLRVCGADASKLDCQAKSTLTSQMSKSDPDSNGAVSALDEGNVSLSPHLTTPATDAGSGEGFSTPIFDAQMSPKKALRAAMLKSRFAETILKAQKKTLLDHVKKDWNGGSAKKRQRLKLKSGLLNMLPK
uniref:Bromo domain-containing protein n=1 Tax=Gossypium raimondii TaxID=29730 RepID=A0A0D2T1S1_GOSRA|nr:hypothetical protein B456_011G034900 [Gossypium raimondii]